MTRSIMPAQNLKVALLPIDIVNGNPKASAEIAFSRIRDVDADTDLIVLPELFTSGFINSSEALTEAAHSSNDIIEQLQGVCNQRDCAIAGSIIAKEGDSLFNRGFLLRPFACASFYDKRHLFSQGGEARILTKGERLPDIVDAKGWRVKLAICYDIRFPVWNRNRANEYDVLVVPANWPQSRDYAWRHMLIARAIENQCFVLGCNREGEDLYGVYDCGSSKIYNNWGADISSYLENGTVTAILYADLFESDRTKFAPWRDADEFTLGS